MFFGRTDANAETSILWPSHVKIDSLESALVMGGIGGRKRRGQDRMTYLDGITYSMDMSLSELQDGQGGLMFCDSWGCKDLDTTE